MSVDALPVLVKLLPYPRLWDGGRVSLTLSVWTYGRDVHDDRSRFIAKFAKITTYIQLKVDLFEVHL